MLGDGAERELLELPIAKASLEMTEEMMLKKTEKNRKRRLQAQKRKERRKVRTHLRPCRLYTTGTYQMEDKLITRTLSSIQYHTQEGEDGG